MTIHVSSENNSPPSPDVNNPSSSSPLTPLGGVEKIEKDYKTKRNKNNTVTVTKIISLKYGDTQREFELKIHNIADDPKVISRFLGEQENKLLSIALIQLTRNKQGSVFYDREKGTYSTAFKRPFLLTFLGSLNPFSKPGEKKNFSVNTTSREKFFNLQLDNLKGKLELYDTMQKLGPKVKAGDEEGLTQDELDLFDVMKNNREITSIPKYKSLFASDVYYNQSYFDSLADKKQKVEGRIELCTTAARVYLTLTAPKPKPKPATTPPTPPIPNPIQRRVDNGS